MKHKLDKVKLNFPTVVNLLQQTCSCEQKILHMAPKICVGVGKESVGSWGGFNAWGTMFKF